MKSGNGAAIHIYIHRRQFGPASHRLLYRNLFTFETKRETNGRYREDRTFSARG